MKEENVKPLYPTGIVVNEEMKGAESFVVDKPSLNIIRTQLQEILTARGTASGTTCEVIDVSDSSLTYEHYLPATGEIKIYHVHYTWSFDTGVSINFSSLVTQSVRQHVIDPMDFADVPKSEPPEISNVEPLLPAQNL